MEKIKLVAFDCDGVLTDSKLHYTPSGKVTVTFNTRDGVAIEEFQRRGIEVALISTSKHFAVLRRSLDLEIPHVYTGWFKPFFDSIDDVEDAFLYYAHKRMPESWLLNDIFAPSKKDFFMQLCYRLKINPLESAAFIGDTEADIPTMTQCAVAACPADATQKVLQFRNGENKFILHSRGGDGVLAEFLDYMSDYGRL